PVPPTFDDVDYKFRRLYMRTALYDFMNRKVIGKWIHRPPAPDSAAFDRINQLKVRLKEDPGAGDTRWLWKLAGERMSGLHRQVEEDGGRLALVMLPIIDFLLRPPDTTKPPMKDTWEFWARWAIAEAERGATGPVAVIKPFDEFFAQQERLTAELRELSALPMVDGKYRTIPSRSPHRAESLFLHADVGHYSVRGHRVLGELVFEGLRAAGAFE
ncbi:MAG: hypothetical protein O7B99_05445, partial [Planctomycetota bacterium]|nr:hypothetical protein [Planctomycetota bacterium]